MLNVNTVMRLLRDGSVFCLYIWWCLANAEGHTCERKCEWPPQPRICEYNFVIEWFYTMSKVCNRCPFVVEDCQRPHCIPADGACRPIISVNKMLHGPVIRVCHNDVVRVTVRNQLDNSEAISLHWYGLSMKDTPYMDGVPMLTQCPIPAKTAFTYEFRADPPGTHWWHSHSGMQRSDGLAGAFVVDVAKEKNPHAHLYDVDDKKYVVFVSDWLHQLTLSKFLSYYYSSGDDKAEGILINGKGVFQNFLHQETNISYRTPFEIFYVEKGKRYRFRTVYNAGVNCPFVLSVDDHEVTIIAIDGADVIPYVVTSLIVYGGERFDFIINANKNVSSYWVRVQGIENCGKQSQKAILRYRGARNTEPSTNEMSSENKDCKQLNLWNQKENESYFHLTSLHPLHSAAYPLDKKLTRDKPDAVHFISFDNNTYRNLSPPVLSQPEHELCDIDSSYLYRARTCPCVIDVEIGHLVELLIYDIGRPYSSGRRLHLHGHRLAVVAVDKVDGPLSRELMREIHASGSIQYIINPVMKNTVIVPVGGYSVVRFIADNPGMGLVFRVGKPRDWPRPLGDFPTCGDLAMTEGNGSVNNGKAVFSSIFILITGGLALIIKRLG